MGRHFDPDDMPSGICDSCGEPCTATVVDNGIGPYEFWGSRGVHHEYATVSPCCEAEVVEGDGRVIRKGTRTARKRMKAEEGAIIMPGDKYRFEVWRCWRKDGPNWVFEKKRRIGHEPSIGEHVRVNVKGDELVYGVVRGKDRWGYHVTDYNGGRWHMLPRSRFSPAIPEED